MTLRRFRLARVLRAREVEEQAAQSAYRAAELLARAQELAAEHAAGLLRHERAELAVGLARSHWTPAQIVHRHAALDRLRDHATATRARAVELRRTAEALRAAWQRRRMAVEGLVRLRDRAKSRWLTEDQRAEHVLGDEIALARAFRASSARDSSYQAPVDDELLSRSGPEDR